MPKFSWLSILAALVALLIVGGLLSSYLFPDPVRPQQPLPTFGPAPNPSVSPPVATAEAKQTATVVIKRTRILPDASPGAIASLTPAQEDEVITITLDQATKATAPVVTPQPIVVAIDPEVSEVIRHARFGVMLATVPGVLAGDIQLLRGKPLGTLDRWGVLPKEVHAMELSLDIEANGQQAGVMAATGGKWFFGAGMYGGFAGGSGTFVATGLRF